MGKFIIPIIIAVVVIAAIVAVVLIILKKKKSKEDTSGYLYEGEGETINVNKINEIDNKYRTESVNLSTNYEDIDVTPQNTQEPEKVETLGSNYNENITDEIMDTLSNTEEEKIDTLGSSNDEEIETIDESQIAFGSTSMVTEKQEEKRCSQCGSNLEGVTGFCPGCGKAL